MSRTFERLMSVVLALLASTSLSTSLPTSLPTTLELSAIVAPHTYQQQKLLLLQQKIRQQENQSPETGVKTTKSWVLGPDSDAENFEIDSRNVDSETQNFDVESSSPETDSQNRENESPTQTESRNPENDSRNPEIFESSNGTKAGKKPNVETEAKLKSGYSKVTRQSPTAGEDTNIIVSPPTTASDSSAAKSMDLIREIERQILEDDEADDAEAKGE
ncbi:uncharacterized protein LOC108673749 [Hyalella azteca]|uniref:Uncharacterized protein LOC108673749 n=1 Tax=Hyalella azteca TaxID=294128 RepID=A0A8B7NTM3_HYAAZ|nr:uncharacterized protein LOC108673749 [Hyalella azteca]